MSKYTTEVRFICEFEAGLDKSKGFNSVEEIIKKAAPKIFGTDWPIFDENYRLALETKILRHYYTREICEETVGLWKLRLVDTLNLIMPYYNKLYESETHKFNPLYDTDYTITNDGSSKTTGSKNVDYNSKETDTGSISDDGNNTKTTKNNGKTTSNGNTRSQQNTNTDHNADDSQWALYSDTPQGAVIGIANAAGSVGKDAYLTNAQHNTDVLKEDTVTDSTGTVTSTDTTTTDDTITEKGEVHNKRTLNTLHGRNDDTAEKSTIDNTNKYVEHVAGKRHGTSYSTLLREYRETLLNIDADIVEELSGLFFGLWD